MTGPDGATVLSGRPVGIHSIPGIGVRFVPTVLNRAILDEVIVVTDEDAAARTLSAARSSKCGSALCRTSIAGWNRSHNSGVEPDPGVRD
jgi:cysteine synthase